MISNTADGILNIFICRKFIFHETIINDFIIKSLN